MRVQFAEVKETLLKIILDKSKLSKEDAEILASDYLEGELQGKKTHGIAAFPAVIGILPQAHANYKILKETDSFLFVDAQGGLGAIIGRKVADILIDKARKQGVAYGVIAEMKSWLRPATLAQYIAENDMTAWLVNTGGPPMVAPPGGKEPVVGTNPIGIGIPTSDNPVVVDMATSTRAWGEVRLAKRFNHQLPGNSFFDKEGVPTLDADSAYAAIPMGGYKGFGLGLFIEILGGSFVGMEMGKKGEVNEAYHTRNRGAAILVINPEMTVGKEKFKEQNEEFISRIRNSPPAKGSKKVTIPGDRARASKEKALKNDYLEIDDALWKEIVSFL